MSFLQKALNLFAKKSHIITPTSKGYGYYGYSKYGYKRYDEKKLVDEGYASNSDVYSIVRKISETGSHIKWKLYEELRDGTKEEVTEGELYDLLQMPNQYQTRKQFTEAWLIYILTTGNDYVWGITSEGLGDVYRELALLPAIVTEPIVQTINYFQPTQAYQVDVDVPFQVSADQVLHTKLIDPTYYGLQYKKGLSPLQAGYMSMNASNNRQEAASVMLQNKGAAGIISSGGDYPLNPEEAEKVQEAVDRKLGGAYNFNRIISSSASLNFQQIGMSAADLKIIEQGQLTLRELCNIYSVPSQLFNDVAGTTFNNMEAAKKSLYTESVIPMTQRLIDGLNNWLLPAWEQRDRKNYKIVLDTDKIEVLQNDKKTEAEKDKIVLEGINMVVNMPISDEGKKALLMSKYDMTEEMANVIVENID